MAFVAMQQYFYRSTVIFLLRLFFTLAMIHPLAAHWALDRKGRMEMQLNDILATDRKILFVNNTGHDVSMFENEIRAAIYADSTELPEEIADLLVLSYARISDTENRAILNWA